MALLSRLAKIVGVQSSSSTGNSSERVGQTQAVPHTMLYIDDNPINLRLVAHILGRRPHIHLLTAHTPELGMELALARHPELIVLDINMPGMDGYQVLKQLKADKHLKHTPVIALTAHVLPQDVERGMAAGFNVYLTKPLNVDQFLKTIDTYLSPQPSTPA